MKKYLWAGIAVLFVSAHASENPFDLKENFGKLEQDQDVLLTELRKLAELKELEEDIEEPEQAEEEALVEEDASPVSVNEVANSLTKMLEEDNEIAPSSQLENTSGKSETTPQGNKAFMETLVGTQTDEIEKKQELKAEIAKKETQLQNAKTALVKAEAEKKKQLEAKQEAERLEVEAYEKKRAEKLALEEQKKADKRQQEEAKKQKAANAAKIQADKEAKQKAEKDMAMKKEASLKKAKEKVINTKAVPVKVNTPKTVTSIDDINVTRDKIEARKNADMAYEAAVKEMSEED